MKVISKKGFLGRIGAAALTALGFASCSASPLDPDDGGRVAYGTPTAAFRVAGTVSDASGNPIKGIQVVSALSPGQYFGSRRDTMYTDSDGRFSKQGSLHFVEGATLIFTDVDGEENGGEFKSRSVQVTPQQVEKGNGWFNGTFLIQADIKLEKKNH